MVIVPLSKDANDSETAPRSLEAETMNWVGIAAAGTLVAGGVLLLSGQHRAGLVAAASGTALALLDQQETLRSWWNVLPGYLDDIQRLLGQVQGTMEELATQREKRRRVLAG
jgi:hypothetical protein